MRSLLLAVALLLTSVVVWAAPSYVELKPEFVVNYGQDGRLRYLKAEVTLVARDDSAAIEINHHADYLRHQLVMLLSRQTLDTLNTPSGKDLLREQALKLLQAVMLQETGQSMIDQVLFTNFVIQR
jgi:flagellar FliL protein